MPVRLTELLARVPSEVGEEVKEARDRHRAVVQEVLRSECRLVFKTPAESESKRAGASIAVEISDAHPEILKPIEFDDRYEDILLIARYRKQLEDAGSGLEGLMELYRRLLDRPRAGQWMDVDPGDLRRSHEWARQLLTQLDEWDPVKQIMGVNEDVLGIYWYRPDAQILDEFKPNKAGIKLYWCVIGLVSTMLGCSVEDLTIVVLAHELAHAYTQLGADIEGRRWHAGLFAKTDVEVKEGLAQYYTERVLRRLEKKLPGALRAYETLLPRQPEAYRTHQDWTDSHNPEAIRLAMLELRRGGETSLENFNIRLAAASAGLGK